MKRHSLGSKAPSSVNALQVLETADELNQCLRKLHRLEEASKKIHKDGKKGMEFISELAKCEQKLATDLSNSPLCQHDEQLRNLAEVYLSVTKNMDQHTNDLVLVSQNALVEPMKRYLVIFSHVATLLKKRDNHVQECQKWKSKLEKQKDKEKTGPNLAKTNQFNKSLQQAEEALAEHNRQLLVELPPLLTYRINYLQPCFEALIRGQVEYFGCNTRLYSQLAGSVPTVPTLKDDEYQQRFNDRIAEIKALSIVANIHI